MKMQKNFFSKFRGWFLRCQPRSSVSGVAKSQVANMWLNTARDAYARVRNGKEQDLDLYLVAATFEKAIT
jgi:hypothetical protein